LGLLPFAGAWQLLSLWYVIEYVKGMRTTSYSEFRRNLAAELDSVADDHAPLIITRDRGKPAAVLMSLEDYASLEETRYLLSSPANAERLMASIAELEEGNGTEHELLA
jgi:antitoxin YefM